MGHVVASRKFGFSDASDPGATLRLLVIADSTGPTQHISFVRPLEAWRQAGAAAVRLIDERLLEQVRRDVSEKAIRKLLEREVASFDPTLIVLSRYSGRDYATIFSIARKARIPIVYHLDDDLFEVPIGLGIDLYRKYRQPNRVYAMYEIAERCDLIYVSTPALAARVRQRVPGKRLMTSRIYVGAQPQPVRPYRTPRDNGLVHMGYMASAGHAFDFELAAPALHAILRRMPNVRLHLFGTIADTEIAREFGDALVRHERITSSYADFREAMSTLDWDIGLAPLRMNEFNLCRAPTKWLEYADAGIATLASDHPVYRPLGQEHALALSEDCRWETELEALIADPNRRAALVRRSREVLNHDYDWLRMEDQLLDLVAAVDRAAAVGLD